MEEKSFVERQNENLNRQAEPVEPKVRKRFIDDKQRCGMFTIFIGASLTLPIIFYFITINVTTEPIIDYSCGTDEFYKIPCGRANISKAECIKLECCYDDFKFDCYHFMPAKYNYHIKKDIGGFYSLQPKTPLGNDTIPELKISILEINSNKVKIILHVPSTSYNSTTVQNKTYNVRQDDRMIGVEIFRQDTTETILSTLKGPLIASNHYWEWTVRLINDHLLGLGELSFPVNKTLTKVIYKSRKDHTTLPNFVGYLNGSFYGILFEHDGPLEVTVLPSKIIILKSLAGDKIAINVCTGPTIKDVIQQMRVNAFLPVPYWTLGAHICRDGSTTIENALNEFTQFHQTQKDIHYASDCIHENLYNMLYQVKPEHNLTGLISLLQQQKTKFLMSIPSQVLKINKEIYNKAVELNILYTNGEMNYTGSYQNQEAVYPDYTHPLIGEWFKTIKLNLPANNIDGYVLRDNWPDEDTYVFKDPNYTFPYMTNMLNQSLSNTLFWNATSTNNSLHILNHNSYGNAHLSAFRNYMQYEFIITSSFDSDVSEAISVQHVNISWQHLKRTVSTILSNSMFGYYLTSIPICGSTNAYNNKTNDELCLQWYLTSVTLPLFRISSDFPRRDPSNLFSGFTKQVVQDAIKKRFMLLPYYHTVLSLGDPLVRPMIYNFYKNNATWNLDEQYMLGDALLVAQPFLPALNKLQLYLPPEVKVWYEFWGGNPYNVTGWMNFHVVKADWVMFLSEGNIVPLRHHKSTRIGEFGPNDSFGFAVALNCSIPECFAKGLLHLKDTQLLLTANKTGILITNILEAQNDIGCSLVDPTHPKLIEDLQIYGILDVLVKSNFTTIDLCNITESVLYIPYFLV